jgi:hypothetical protein
MANEAWDETKQASNAANETWFVANRASDGTNEASDAINQSWFIASEASDEAFDAYGKPEEGRNLLKSAHFTAETLQIKVLALFLTPPIPPAKRQQSKDSQSE